MLLDTVDTVLDMVERLQLPSKPPIKPKQLTIPSPLLLPRLPSKQRPYLLPRLLMLPSKLRQL